MEKKEKRKSSDKHPLGKNSQAQELTISFRGQNTGDIKSLTSVNRASMVSFRITCFIYLMFYISLVIKLSTLLLPTLVSVPVLFSQKYFHLGLAD